MRNTRFARGLAGVTVMLAIASRGALGADANGSDEPPALGWLRDLLAASSELKVAESDDQPAAVATTRTNGVVSKGSFILEYELSTFTRGEPTTLHRRQLILYTLRPDTLDGATLSAQKIDDENGGDPSWVVSVGIQEGAEFISYDNLVESRNDDGSPELTRSRGRVRQVALGYFSREEQAATLIEKIRAYLGTLPARGAKPVTDSARSDA